MAHTSSLDERYAYTRMNEARESRYIYESVAALGVMAHTSSLDKRYNSTLK